MQTESDNMEDLSEQEGSLAQENQTSRLIALDRHLAEVLAAQREISDRLEAIERQTAGVASPDHGAPETKVLWEDTVRRFTGSIDVRLDILEDELGGLQDELNRLRQVASESAEGVQRRLTRRYALGQAILGVLVLVFMLVTWSGGERALGIGSPSDLVAHTPEAPPLESSLDSPVARSRTDRSPAYETETGVETDPSAPLRLDSGAGQAMLPAALPGTSVSDKKAGGDAAEPGSRASKGVQAQPPGVPGNSEGSEQPNRANAPLRPSTVGPGGAEIDESKAVSQAPAGTETDTGSKEARSVAESDTRSATESDEETIVLTEERFAVQLVGFVSESWVWRFVEKFGIVGTARYLHIPEEDRDMYLVLLGDYETREQGKAAMDALPSKLRDLKPFVRTLPPGTRLVPIKAATGTD